MLSYLITPTLLNSYQFYLDCDYESPAKSRADFLKVLSKEKIEPTEAMQKGIDFEKDIQTAYEDKIDIFHEDYDERQDVINQIARIVKGGLWQATCKKYLQVNNIDFLLYGRCDVIKRDTIYDIKFTNNYNVGKFLKSNQHLIYLYCTNMPKFSYLISDGQEWWREDYFNSHIIEDLIKSNISNFMNYLENDKEAKEIYFEKWRSK